MTYTDNVKDDFMARMKAKSEQYKLTLNLVKRLIDVCDDELYKATDVCLRFHMIYGEDWHDYVRYLYADKFGV